MLLAGGRLVTAEAVLDPGWVLVRDGRVVQFGQGAPPGAAEVDLGGYVVVPGFVDMHVHGGGGGGFSGADLDGVARAVRFARSSGTTTTMASLVTAAPEVLEREVAALRDLVDDGELAGLHLEGPWLSAARCGAHDPGLLRPPDRGEVERLLRVGGGGVRMVTLAPELDGALDAVRQLVGSGVVVAVGHTEAPYATTRAAVEAGASVGTHLYNAMRPASAREPGPALALLEDPRVTIELVGDGVHLHPALLAYTIATVGPRRVALITDAMAAAGMGDGRYQLGALTVEVRDGRARLPGTDTIAGSTATMAGMFRALVQESGLTLPTVVALTSATPAAALGLTEVGSLAPGRWADLVVLDAGLEVAGVLRRGHWVRPV